MSGENTKNKKFDNVPLLGFLCEYLQDKKLDRISVPKIEQLKKDLSVAGLPFIDQNNMRVDFHAFRKSCCTILHELNVSDVKIMKIMRHSDINLTVNTYNDLNRLGLHEAIESLAASKELTAILTESPDFLCQNMSFSDKNRNLEKQILKYSESMDLHAVSRYDNKRKNGRPISVLSNFSAENLRRSKAISGQGQIHAFKFPLL